MAEMRAIAGAPDHLRIEVISTRALTAAMRAAISALCNRAFAHVDGVHDFATLFAFVTDSRHVLASEGDTLVGHACWEVRRIQPKGLSPLRTAYVDAVATEPARQGRGIGSAVMRRFAAEAADCQLHALATDSAPGFYERLGWERWRGPLAARTPRGLEPTPVDGDIVLIHGTPTTPALDLTARLIAHDRPHHPW
jgi:aminoglycoside 2'-N-acetyltransferase I